jgi:hypothetical protein
MKFLKRAAAFAGLNENVKDRTHVGEDFDI